MAVNLLIGGIGYGMAVARRRLISAGTGEDECAERRLDAEKWHM